MRDCKVFNSWMNQRAKTYRSLVNAKSLRDIGPFIPGVRCWDSLVRTRDGHAVWGLRVLLRAEVEILHRRNCGLTGVFRMHVLLMIVGISGCVAQRQYSTKPGTNPSWGVQRRQAAARHPGVVGHRCERPGHGLRQHGQRLCHRCWVPVPCGCFPVASVSATAVRAWFAHSSLRKRTGFMMQTSWDLQWCI